VRRSPAEVGGALADALTRVGRFTGASMVVLLVRPEDSTGVGTCLAWTQADDSVESYARRSDVPSGDDAGRLEIPLVAQAAHGTLELHAALGRSWPADQALRLGAVSDLIAGALDRAATGRALDETRRQLEHLARVATVSGLAAAVSHQLRQPLTAIRANAEAGALLLADSPPDVNEARQALQEIARDNARAAEVIDHFLTLYRKKEPLSTAVDLNALCRQIAKLLEHEVSRQQARLVLRLDPQLPAVRGDPVQLQQALINLTLNALDALSAADADREATIRTAANNGEVEVSVSDTGTGFTPDAQKRLFEPFFSTKTHGIGMGLTIVRSIVERHHGVLRAENLSAGGALFTVTLPGGRVHAPPATEMSAGDE